MKLHHSPQPASARSGSKTSEAGFTLFEILIAIFIFAIVVTTIFGSYNFVFSTVDDLDRTLTIDETARNCLDRMVFDLQGLYVSLPPEYQKPEFNAPPDLYRFAGEIETVANEAFPRLRFCSLAHVALERSQREGVAQIVYYVQPDGNDSFVLRRSDTLYPYAPYEPFQGKGSDPILCDDLKSLKIIYYDLEGNEDDHWDSESDAFRYATPRAVGIELELGRGSASRRFATMTLLPAYRPKSE